MSSAADLGYRDAPDSSGSPAATRRLPPIAEMAVASIILMMGGGIYLASYLPRHPPLGVPLGLVIAGGALTLIDVAILARIRPFAWQTFFLVLRWALLAYLVIAGLLAFVFIHNDVTGNTLGVLVATLFVFAVDVPTILAFTVARFWEQPTADPAR
ncbi:MAG: hypothetical protein ACRDYY_02405 [Acidimicrobiales bacterium]